MTAKVQSLPGALPLHEDKDFLRESEWVILKLLCRSLDSLADNDAEELSAASGNQLTIERCKQLISIIRLSKRAGLGSWAARLMVEAGLDEQEIDALNAEKISAKVNLHMGYAIFNPATTRALADLQEKWRYQTQQENA